MLEIMKASAGSGKTYNLAGKYIGLLLKSEDRYAYRHILAVTFTNKATDEMKNRIMKEYLSVIYFKVVYYSTDYENEMDEMKEIWEYYINYFGITAGSEGGALPDIFK